MCQTKDLNMQHLTDLLNPAEIQIEYLFNA